MLIKHLARNRKRHAMRLLVNKSLLYQTYPNPSQQLRNRKILEVSNYVFKEYVTFLLIMLISDEFVPLRL